MLVPQPARVSQRPPVPFLLHWLLFQSPPLPSAQFHLRLLFQSLQLERDVKIPVISVDRASRTPSESHLSTELAASPQFQPVVLPPSLYSNVQFPGFLLWSTRYWGASKTCTDLSDLPDFLLLMSKLMSLPPKDTYNASSGT